MVLKKGNGSASAILLAKSKYHNENKDVPTLTRGTKLDRTPT